MVCTGSWNVAGISWGTLSLRAERLPGESCNWPWLKTLRSYWYLPRYLHELLLALLLKYPEHLQTVCLPCLTTSGLLAVGSVAFTSVFSGVCCWLIKFKAVTSVSLNIIVGVKISYGVQWLYVSYRSCIGSLALQKMYFLQHADSLQKIKLT